MASNFLRLASTTALFSSAVAAPIQFNRDIKPLLSENCFHCHGPDPGTRKAGLRLDTQTGLFEKTEKRGPTVIPGKPLESPFYQRIISTDPDEIMPPPDGHKELKPEQRELLRLWIEQGAVWQPHWSFIKPTRPSPPLPPNGNAQVKNPIDNFIQAKLAEKELLPNDETDKRSLARRVALDLTGLPPNIADVEAFVIDSSPNAYETFVDRLLASKDYGEHRARYWLDAARYGDTHGLHFDNYREMWPYRTWVINAFNDNMRFDQFTLEQISGDLLPNPTQDQLIATGFHRCNITTNEGGTIVEENLWNYAKDRVSTTSWVWLGLTANCAECHDHKFDPVSMKDFYSMAAFFKNTKQGGLDGNVKDSNPSIVVPATAQDQSRYAAIPSEITKAQQAQSERKSVAAADFEAWVKAAKPEDIAAGIPSDSLVAHVPLNDGAGEEVKATCGQPMTLKATGPVVWQPNGKIGPAPVIKATSTFDLGSLGDFEKDQAFSYGAWVKSSGDGSYGGVMARMESPQNNYRGWDLLHSGREYAVHIVHNWPDNALRVATTGKVVKKGQWQHVFVTYDGSGKAEGIRIFIDGAAVATKASAQSLTGSIRTANAPLTLGRRSATDIFEGGSIQDVRIYNRRIRTAEVMAIYQSGPLKEILAAAVDKRTAEQKEALFVHYLNTRDTAYQELTKQIEALQAEKSAITARSAVTHIQEEKMDSKPMAAILFRGQYDQEKEKVEPAAFHALHPFPEKAPRNRLGLARWLIDPQNPLTARVTVNRFWQELFGTGLVKTADDFGVVGEAPSHPELLDWLAIEFQESGWDVKKLIKLMVMSHTYRQSTTTTPDKLEKDGANRLLSRGPRFRMDAEMVRDVALASSGLLVKKIGGPSVKPYQPEGVWEAVAMPESNTKNYKQDSGENLYRRSLYTFIKRAAPPASLEILNATAREVSCVRRERTNTPLQALVTMNDTQFVEAARHLAQRALLGSEGNVDIGVNFMARNLLSRSLRPDELEIVKSAIAEMQAHYVAAPEEAQKLLSVGESKPNATLAPTQLAAWTMIANQLMNLDEVLNK